MLLLLLIQTASSSPNNNHFSTFSFPFLFPIFYLKMRSVSTATLIFSCVASIASAAPLTFDDGFPNPSADQLNTIEVAAHGSLPVAAAPVKGAAPAKPVR
jgi:hypothetical protein